MLTCRLQNQVMHGCFAEGGVQVEGVLLVGDAVNAFWEGCSRTAPDQVLCQIHHGIIIYICLQP